MSTDEHVKMSPKDFFLYIAATVTLYVSAVSLITLWFQYINRLFPSPLETYMDPFSGAIRFAIASLIVIFPLYVGIMRYLNQDVRKNPDKKKLNIRRWLIFLTLFVAGMTIVIDLIVLINTFLGGEITARFVLKVLTVLVVVGTGFGYYFYSLKGRWEKSERQSVIIGGVISLVVFASIISGFFIVGSPATQQGLRLDQQRVRDLDSIQWQITNFWQDKERLPNSLNELEDPLIRFIVPTDPKTQEAYRYRATDDVSFELCAVFEQESISGSKSAARLEFGSVNENFEHGIGETCFERTIDSERFSPLLKELPVRR